MAQITVRLSEAQSGIKGGISIGTGRSNLESALSVAAAAIERNQGSVDMGALREAISTQNVGASANVQEQLEEFEEALDLGVSPEIFNSAINTRALIKAAQDKWLDEGGPITSADVQAIDAPIKEVQRAAAMADYNRMANRDPSQTVADLSRDRSRLFGIDPDAQISDLTDTQLGDIVKQGLGGQGVSDSLFWSARNEQSSRGTTVSENQFTGALESTPLSEAEKAGFVEGTDLSSTISGSLTEEPEVYEPYQPQETTPSPENLDDTPYTLFLRRLLGTDTSGWANDQEGLASLFGMAKNYVLNNPDYGDEAARRAAADDYHNVMKVLSSAVGDLGTIGGFETTSIGTFMNANADMWGGKEPSGADLSGYDLSPITTTAAATSTFPDLTGDSGGLNFLQDILKPGGAEGLDLTPGMYGSERLVPFQTAWRQEAAATPGSMNPLARRAIAAQNPFAELQYRLQPGSLMNPSGGSPREFLRDYQGWSPQEFEAQTIAALEEAEMWRNISAETLTDEDIMLSERGGWLQDPQNMVSMLGAPSLLRTDPFKRDMVRSGFQRLYDIAANRDPTGGKNVDIASLFGRLR